MAVSDIVNSQGIQFQGGSQNFNTNQYNQNGESLTPTPPANGVTPSNDWSSDSRTSIEHKQDHIQAQVDTATQTQDDDNYYVDPKTAYKMKKVPTSMGDQIKTFITQYLIGLNTHDGDAYAAGLEGGQAVQNTLDIADRQTQFHDLLAKGYNGMDIEKWAVTGDTKALPTNKGKTVRYGNILYNELTGEKVGELPLSLEDQFKRDQMKMTQEHYRNQDIIGAQNADTASGNLLLNQRKEGGLGGTGFGDDGSEDEGAGANNSATKTFPDMPRRGASAPDLTRITKEFNQPIDAFNTANQVVQEMDSAKGGTPDERNQATIAAGDRLVRTLLGGNATLSPEAIEHMTGTPVKKDQWANYLAVQSGKGNPDQALEFIKGIAISAREGYRTRIRNQVSAERDNMKRYTKGNPHQATADIMATAGLSPDMFMTNKEQEEWNTGKHWTKLSGLHERKAAPVTSTTGGKDHSSLWN